MKKIEEGKGMVGWRKVELDWSMEEDLRVDKWKGGGETGSGLSSWVDEEKRDARVCA